MTIGTTGLIIGMVASSVFVSYCVYLFIKKNAVQNYVIEKQALDAKLDQSIQDSIDNIRSKTEYEKSQIPDNWADVDKLRSKSRSKLLSKKKTKV